MGEATLSYSDLTECFYDCANGRTIDAVHPRTGRGVWGGRTLEEVREEYPEAVRITLDEAVARSDAHYRQPPTPTTAEQFDEMLDVLPPVAWHRDTQCESFKMSERTSGNITAIYCRIGDRYWHLADDIRTPHARIVELCRAAEVRP